MSRKLVTALVLTVAFGAVAISTSPSHAGGCFRGGYYTSVAIARPYIHHNPVVFAHLPQERLASAPSGSTITLPANFLGDHPGSVFMVFNNIKLPIEIVKWCNTGVTIKLPPMAQRHSLRVRLDVVLPHGKLGLQQRLLITPPADVILHPVAPTSPLPTNAALLQNGAIPAGE